MTTEERLDALETMLCRIAQKTGWRPFVFDKEDDGEYHERCIFCGSKQEIGGWKVHNSGCFVLSLRGKGWLFADKAQESE